MRTYVHRRSTSLLVFCSIKISLDTVQAASENLFVLSIFSPYRNGGYFGGVFICALLVTIGYSTIWMELYAKLCCNGTRSAFAYTYVRRWCMAQQFHKLKFINAMDGFCLSHFWSEWKNHIFTYLPFEKMLCGKCESMAAHFTRNFFIV